LFPYSPAFRMQLAGHGVTCIKGFLGRQDEGEFAVWVVTTPLGFDAFIGVDRSGDVVTMIGDEKGLHETVNQEGLLELVASFFAPEDEADCELFDIESHDELAAVGVLYGVLGDAGAPTPEPLAPATLRLTLRMLEALDRAQLPLLTGCDALSKVVVQQGAGFTGQVAEMQTRHDAELANQRQRHLDELQRMRIRYEAACHRADSADAQLALARARPNAHDAPVVPMRERLAAFFEEG
jgi:hypothetical protein